MISVMIHEDVKKQVQEALLRVHAHLEDMSFEKRENTKKIEPQDIYESDILRVVFDIIQAGSIATMMTEMKDIHGVMKKSVEEEEEDCDGDCDKCDTGHEVEKRFRALLEDMKTKEDSAVGIEFLGRHKNKKKENDIYI